ncbi:MAG: LytTR family DNA-binding domain-containing protein [Bacteroidota bacterium]|nr:LytTR family DNA-binding domain-containing protein [Bacteroidota bacterium]
MLRFLIVDDAGCKKELDRFILKHKASVKVNEASNTLTEKIVKLTQTVAQGTKIAIRTNNNIDLVNVNDIIRLESKRNYTKLHFTDKKNMVLSKTLRECEAMFASRGFLRIHKSHLINMAFMNSYSKSDALVLMKDGSKIPVSLRKKETLFKELEKL